MNFATFIIALIVFVPVAVIAYRQIKKAKSGQTGCGCGCSGCSQAKNCQSLEDRKDLH